MTHLLNKFVSSVSSALDINQATLSGAIDIVVVKHDDGTMLCTPFHVRFGKLQLLRSKEKVVTITCNNEVLDWNMKLGSAGEAFFVVTTDQPVDEEWMTSPIASPVHSPVTEPVAHDLSDFDLDDDVQPHKPSPQRSDSIMSAPVKRQLPSNEVKPTQISQKLTERGSSQQDIRTSTYKSPPRMRRSRTPLVKSTRRGLVDNAFSPARVSRSGALSPSVPLVLSPPDSPSSDDATDRNDRTWWAWKWGDLPQRRKSQVGVDMPSSPGAMVSGDESPQQFVSGSVGAQDLAQVRLDIDEERVEELGESNAPTPHAHGLPDDEKKSWMSSFINIFKNKPRKRKSNRRRNRSMEESDLLRANHRIEDDLLRVMSDVEHPAKFDLADSSDNHDNNGSGSEHELAKARVQSTTQHRTTLKRGGPQEVGFLPPSEAVRTSARRRARRRSMVNRSKRPPIDAQPTEDSVVLAQKLLPGSDNLNSTNEPGSDAATGALRLSEDEADDEDDAEANRPDVQGSPNSDAPIKESDSNGIHSGPPWQPVPLERTLSGSRSKRLSWSTQDPALALSPGVPLLPQPESPPPFTFDSADLTPHDRSSLDGDTSGDAEPALDMSLCGHLLSRSSWSTARAIFEEHRITYQRFCESPDLAFNSKLVFRYQNKLYPAHVALPLLLSQLAFQRPLTITDHTLDKLKVSVHPSSNGHDGTRSPNPSSSQESIPPSTPEEASSKSMKSVRSNRRWYHFSWFTGDRNDPLPKSVPNSVHPGPVEPSSVKSADSHPQSPLSNPTSPTSDPSKEPKVYYKKALRPTQDMLKSMKLKPGRNIITFSVTSAMQGTQIVAASLYMWKPTSKIIISDIDGTITKSDILGNLMPLVGRDWSHEGVTSLFSNIVKNGYHILYLTSRAIGQANITRGYIRSLKQKDGTSLPEGPVIMSPDRLIASFKREVVYRRPQEFKIVALRDVRQLFGKEFNCFYAGFGNRATDVVAYRAVGVPVSKIFIINRHGEISNVNSNYVKSYPLLNELVDRMFPAEDATAVDDSFNERNYWRQDFVPLDSDSECSSGELE